MQRNANSRHNSSHRGSRPLDRKRGGGTGVLDQVQAQVRVKAREILPHAIPDHHNPVMMKDTST